MPTQPRDCSSWGWGWWYGCGGGDDDIGDDGGGDDVGGEDGGGEDEREGVIVDYFYAKRGMFIQ